MVERTNRLVNIVGVNTPDLSLRDLQKNQAPQLQDTTAQDFAQTRQNIENIYKSQLQMSQEYAQQRTIEASSRGRSNAAASLSGVAEAFLGAASTFKQIEDQKKKAEREAADEAAKAAIQQRALLARQLVQDTLANYEETVATQGYEEGINATERRLNQITRVDFADLPPDLLEPLTTLGFNQLQQARERSTTRTFNAADELRGNQRDTQRTGLELNLATNFAQLAYSASPEEATNTINGIFQYLQENTQGMSVEDRLAIVNPLVQRAVTALGARGVEFEGTSARLGAITEFTAFLETARSEYGNNPDAFRAIINLKATELGIPEFASGVSTNLQLLQDTNSYNAANQSLLDHQNTLEAQNLQRNYPDYLASAVAVRAQEMVNNPAAETVINSILANPGAQDPILLQAAQQAKAFRDAQNDYRTRTTAYRGDVERLANLTRRAVPAPPGSNIRTMLVRDFTGNYTGDVQQIQLPDGSVVQPRPEVSQQELVEAARTLSLSEANVRNLQTEWAARGFNLANPSDTTLMRANRERVQSFETNARSLNSNPEALTPTQTNFNQGAAPGNAPPRNAQPLLVSEGRVMPFRPGTNVVVTSGYGNRTHPTRGGTRFHSGIDLAPSATTRGRSIGVGALSAGTVISAGSSGSRSDPGYGAWVQIQTADGHIEEYGHVFGIDVRVGQQVAQGQQIATLPSNQEWYKRDNDSSTGNHLHLTVRQPGRTAAPNGGNSIDPVAYMQRLASRPAQSATVPGLGLPPNQRNGGVPNQSQLQPGGQQNVGGGRVPLFVFDSRSGIYVRNTQVANPAAPTRTVRAPIARSAYPSTSNPTANYGYAALRDNPQMAAAFAEVANAVGFPAQWLVDIAAHESAGFQPRIQNGRTNATGIIQFMPETADSLGYTIPQIRGMSATEQLRRPTRDYLMEWRGRINSIEDLLAAIWSGAPGYGRSVADRRTINDRTMFTDASGVRRIFMFPDYLDRLGRDAGRSYAHSYRQAEPTHNSFTAGCAQCQAQMAQGGRITPHTAR